MSCALECEVTPVFAHEPVLKTEVVDLIAGAAPGTIVDCTVGGGGHAAALLEALPEARLIGIDRDPTAVSATRERLATFGDRVTIVHERFAKLSEVLAGLSLDRVGAILADLGVSSHQLDTAARGFSFRADGALDMRMDPTSGRSAAELLSSIDIDELARALRDLGEERHARRVARAVVAERPTTTAALADLIRRIVPKARDRLDPATRTFQAIRMLVNDELGELEAWLAAVPELLEDSGVVVAISFHSLEDRAVKEAFRRAANPCTCPPQLPECLCGAVPTLEVLTKRPVRPGPDECRRNPRAESSRLRAARRLARSA